MRIGLLFGVLGILLSLPGVGSAATPAAPVLCPGSGAECDTAGADNGTYSIRAPIPAGWDQYINWPNPPNTTRSATVSSTSQLQSEIDRGSVSITVANGTYSGIHIGASDSDIAITAATPGGAVFSSFRSEGTRVRVTGVRFPNRVDLSQGPIDHLFDNIHATESGYAVPTVIVGGSTGSQSRGDFARLAFINSTIEHLGANAWTFLVANPPSDSSHNRDFILANSYLALAPNAPTTAKTFRMGHIENMIIVDNYMFAPSTISNQFRSHAHTYNLLISNNVFVEGSSQLYLDPAGDGVSNHPVDNVYIIGNRFHERFNGQGGGPFTAMSNIAPVSNAYAVNNDHYAAAQSSGSSSMNRGPTSWSTYSDNVRRAYQTPPSRTQGASH